MPPSSRCAGPAASAPSPAAHKEIRQALQSPDQARPNSASRLRSFGLLPRQDANSLGCRQVKLWRVSYTLARPIDVLVGQRHFRRNEGTTDAAFRRSRFAFRFSQCRRDAALGLTRLKLASTRNADTGSQPVVKQRSLALAKGEKRIAWSEKPGLCFTYARSRALSGNAEGRRRPGQGRIAFTGQGSAGRPLLRIAAPHAEARRTRRRDRLGGELRILRLGDAVARERRSRLAAACQRWQSEQRISRRAFNRRDPAPPRLPACPHCDRYHQLGCNSDRAQASRRRGRGHLRWHRAQQFARSTHVASGIYGL